MGEKYFDDDLEQIAQTSMGFGSGGGGGRSRDQPTWTSPFARLAKGKTLGKRIIMNRIIGSVDAVSPINILEITGENADAMQLGITFLPPLVLPTTGIVLPTNPQDINGLMSNFGEIGGGGVVPPGIPAAFVWDQLIGIIEWGIGGASYYAIVDIMNGCMVNVQASFCRLRGLLGLISGATAAAYGVSAFIGPAHVAPTHAQFTDRYGSVVAGASGAVRNIPWFAKEITILADTNDNMFTIIFFNDRAAAVEVGRYVISTATPGNSIPGTKLPIPGAGAYAYRIVNNGPVDQRYRAIFDLAI